MNLTKALKKLYKKIVGSDAKAKNASGVLNELAENYVAELPAYSASDSGKVLAVKSDGSLEWKTLG